MGIFIQRNGVKDGPFKADQIKALVVEGQLSFEDLAFVPGNADWIPLKDIPELMNEIVPPVPQPEETQAKTIKPILKKKKRTLIDDILAVAGWTAVGMFAFFKLTGIGSKYIDRAGAWVFGSEQKMRLPGSEPPVELASSLWFIAGIALLYISIVVVAMRTPNKGRKQ